MNELTQLIYCSTSKEQLTIAELESILTTSRKKNTEADVTGMLLYTQSSFIQVLEGPAKQVSQIYGRIILDTRHKNIILLYESTVRRRDFPSWAMAFKGFQGNAIAGISDFLHPIRSKDEYAISEGSAKRLLKRFREINKR